MNAVHNRHHPPGNVRLYAVGLAAALLLHSCGGVVAQAGAAPANGTRSNSTAAEQFILNGEFRFYGANLASNADELIATATVVSRPILQSFTLNLVRLNKTDAVAAVTPGLEGFDTVDAAFFFTVSDLTADLSNLLTVSSANVLLRLLTTQLKNAGLNVGLQLLWVDYTSTEGVFPPGGQPPNFQAVHTTLEVTGTELVPFRNDKQTLLLAALTRAYQRVNAPLVCLNITSSRAATGSPARRLLASDVIHVDLDFIITPPTNETMTAMFARILKPGLSNVTATLGLLMEATYRNSTVELEGPTGQRISVTCDPPRASCLADAAAAIAPAPAPSEGSGDSNAALIGGLVGGVVGGILLLAAAIAGVLLWRKQRRRRAGVAPKLSPSTDSSVTAGGLSNGVKPHPSAEAAVGSSRGEPLRDVYGGAAAGRDGLSDDDSGQQRDLQQTKQLADSARMDDGEARKQRLRSAAGGPGAREVVLIPASEIVLCKRPDGSDFALGEGAFGRVYKALRNNVQEVAIKVLTHGCDEVMMQELRREVAILQRVSADANVVQFYGAVLPDGSSSASTAMPAMLVMEYLAGGDLRHALAADDDDEFRWDCRGREVAIDIARGLHFLHSAGVVHRDIKSSNVLLTAEGRAKIADVGLAKVATAYFSAANTIGTFSYAAPEMLLGHSCTEKVDIFSFGVVLWELIMKTSPVRGQLSDLSSCGRCPESVAALFRDCIATDAAGRPTAAEVFQRLSSAA